MGTSSAAMYFSDEENNRRARAGTGRSMFPPIFQYLEPLLREVYMANIDSFSLRLAGLPAGTDDIEDLNSKLHHSFGPWVRATLSSDEQTRVVYVDINALF